MKCPPPHRHWCDIREHLGEWRQCTAVDADTSVRCSRRAEHDGNCAGFGFKMTELVHFRKVS